MKIVHVKWKAKKNKGCKKPESSLDVSCVNSDAQLQLEKTLQGPGADAKPITLSVEDQDYMGRIKQLQVYLEQVRNIVKPGCPQEVLKAALSAMGSVTEVLSVMTSAASNGLSSL